MNEAYVSLSQILETEEGARKESAKKEEEKQKAEKQATKEQAAKEQAKNERVQKEQAKQNKAQKEQAKYNTKSEQEEEKEYQNTQAHASRKRAASAAYAKEDVLRDLLHDPFARRVFEDIYSEVSKQAKPSAKPPPPPPPQQPKQQAKQAKQAKQQPTQQSTPTVEVEIGDSNNLSHVANNFSGKIMGWFRQQIDETQSIKMPASALFAGARIRLQIRRGLSDDLSTVEIVLPRDFVAGKPIRLRGLGKKVGKWQGDLYLTIDCIQK